MSWLGLDIGGANLKAATTDGTSRLVPFRFWAQSDRLESHLIELINSFGGHHVCNIAATMTAELADCFDSRQDGVHQIVDAVVSVCRQLGIQEPRFATTDGTLRSATDAKNDWLGTAAANWAMLATHVSRFLPNRTGVVIDMGSTTTDIIPVKNGALDVIGKTDFGRLANGELVYAGVDRTPVCSLVNSLKLGDQRVPVAREFFATVADAMIVCGLSDEDSLNVSTADGKPKTVANASARICRMICEDAVCLSELSVQSLANQILGSLERSVIAGIETVFARALPSHVIVTGSGKEFAMAVLAKSFPDVDIVSIANLPDESAPAYAVAVLASESSVSRS